MFRSTTEAGKIKLKAKAKGLKSAQISLNSVPFESTNGLSTQFLEADLPLNLERGPTPKTSSYSKKRETIYIANATAGANQEETYHTYDDNELTE